MEDLKNNILNENIAEDTSNILIPDSSAIKSGIVFKSNINSNILNGYLNLLSKAIQYLQFTAGLYNKEADYNDGNIASLVIKNGNDYSIWQFKRNSNNPQVLNNNPPIIGASITTVNGVDIYEGGTLNTDWDKLTEDYNVEATPNTVMIRDEEGASNVNIPSSITDTSIVNNEYLQQQLSTKQDKLVAGTNIKINQDNVISIEGNIATIATQVSQNNTNGLGNNVQIALNNLKNSINTETAQRTQADSDLLSQIGILIPRYMIPPYHTQYPNPATGEFDPNEEPSTWYKKMYGVTTTWQIIFNVKSTFFRTEGAKASIARVNGLQPYGIKTLYGDFQPKSSDINPIGMFITNGCFYNAVTIKRNINYTATIGSNNDLSAHVGFNSGRQIKEYPDDIVVDNYLIRIYKLLTINGKIVSQIIQGA